jgi:hypothetical protein
MVRIKLAFLLLVCSCSLLPQILPRIYNPKEPEIAANTLDTKTIAVMPPENMTFEIYLEQVNWLRAFINDILRRRGFNVVKVADVNAKLKEMKISDAGQLRAYRTEELGKVFNCDAILFWEIVSVEAPSFASVSITLSAVDGRGVLWKMSEFEWLAGVFGGQVEQIMPPFWRVEKRTVKTLAITIAEALRKFPRYAG